MFGNASWSNYSLRAALLPGLPLTAADEAVTVIVCATVLVDPDAFVSVTVVGFALSVVAVSVAVVVGASVSPPVTVATGAAVVPASTVVAPWLSRASLMVLIRATAALNSSVALAILFVCVATTSAALDEAESLAVFSSETSFASQDGLKSAAVRGFRIATMARAFVGLYVASFVPSNALVMSTIAVFTSSKSGFCSGVRIQLIIMNVTKLNFGQNNQIKYLPQFDGVA